MEEFVVITVSDLQEMRGVGVVHGTRSEESKEVLRLWAESESLEATRMRQAFARLGGSLVFETGKARVSFFWGREWVE
jgi:hypothetical protein